VRLAWQNDNLLGERAVFDPVPATQQGTGSRCATAHLLRDALTRPRGPNAVLRGQLAASKSDDAIARCIPRQPGRGGAGSDAKIAASSWRACVRPRCVALWVCCRTAGRRKRVAGTTVCCARAAWRQNRRTANRRKLDGIHRLWQKRRRARQAAPQRAAWAQLHAHKRRRRLPDWLFLVSCNVRVRSTTTVRIMTSSTAPSEEPIKVYWQPG
jgi:hypothetical protein